MPPRRWCPTASEGERSPSLNSGRTSDARLWAAPGRVHAGALEMNDTPAKPQPPIRPRPLMRATRGWDWPPSPKRLGRFSSGAKRRSPNLRAGCSASCSRCYSVSPASAKPRSCAPGSCRGCAGRGTARYTCASITAARPRSRPSRSNRPSCSRRDARASGPRRGWRSRVSRCGSFAPSR